jgi:type IV fimbrial biogenesis protein FimT
MGVFLHHNARSSHRAAAGARATLASHQLPRVANMESRKPRGFSLVESMVVAAVASCLLLVGVPSFSRLFARSAVQSTSSELMLSLAQARMRAVTDATSWSLCPSRDGAACTNGIEWDRGWIVFRDPHETGRPAAGDIADRVRRDPGSPTIRSTAGRRLLSFRADGTSAGSNVTLLVCERGHRIARRVIVSNTGRARVEPLRDGDPACAAPES